MTNDRIQVIFPEAPDVYTHNIVYLTMARVPVKGDIFFIFFNELVAREYRVTKVVFGTFSSLVTVYVEANE